MNRMTPEEISRAAYERNLLFPENAVLAYTRRPDADECIAQRQLASCEDQIRAQKEDIAQRLSAGRKRYWTIEDYRKQSDEILSLILGREK